MVYNRPQGLSNLVEWAFKCNEFLRRFYSTLLNWDCWNSHALCLMYLCHIITTLLPYLHDVIHEYSPIKIIAFKFYNFYLIILFNYCFWADLASNNFCIITNFLEFFCSRLILCYTAFLDGDYKLTGDPLKDMSLKVML